MDRSFVVSNGRRRGVLRYGETTEGLFLIDQSSSEEYRELCRKAVHSAEDDAAVWRRILETVSEKVSNNSRRGSDLIRLHRRATSRFADRTEASGTESSDLLRIWLSYAKAQAMFGHERDSRLTFKHIQNQRFFGAGEPASFYLALANLEAGCGDKLSAEQVLSAGIQKRAQPVSELEEALRKLQERSPMPLSKKSPSRGTIVAKSSPKRLLEQEHPPTKRLKTNREDPRSTTVVDQDDDKTETSNMSMSVETQSTSATITNTISSKDSVRFQLAPPSQTLRKQGVAELPTKMTSVGSVPSREAESTSVGKPAHEPKVEQNPSDGKKEASKTPLQRPSMQIKATRVPSLLSKSAANMSRRPPLLSKTPHLRRGGNLGKPERIDPSQPVTFESDDSDDDHDVAPSTSQQAPAERKPTKRITKMDIAYMLEWDPEKRDSTTPGSNKTGSSRNPSQKAVILEKIEGTPSKSDGSHSSHSNKSTDKKVEPTPETTEKQTDTSAAHRPRPAKSLGTPSTLHENGGETSSALTKFNRDFLPLVSESNMIRVNNTHYAKLGVIGKGGSCKVYRALSTDCSVYAIKKVKLSGMEKRAIDGYANEIALLKRLRGNPAIIQLHDSEVNLQRKAIFLVMEVGEIDLNHVLQQQALSSRGSQRHLNMNFIRLTWQQMLKAVNCIHEERIIHGDLKPANFLFVRGTLKLIDFGIAKAIQNDDTTNITRETQIGTLNYMSPEAFLDTGQSSTGARMKCGRVS
jgi:hypothetical protein